MARCDSCMSRQPKACCSSSADDGADGSFASFRSLRGCRPQYGPSARQIARPVAPGIAPVATRSLSNVTRHSPRQSACPQARTPRRQAIPALLSRDCRLLRATGGVRRRFARVCVLLQKESCGGNHGFMNEGQAAQNRTLREERALGRPARSHITSCSVRRRKSPHCSHIGRNFWPTRGRLTIFLLTRLTFANGM